MGAETDRFTRIAFAVFDGRRRLGHAAESVNGKIDVFVGDKLVITVATKDAARAAIFAALNNPRGAK
jgi:hypothetical protein